MKSEDKQKGSSFHSEEKDSDLLKAYLNGFSDELIMQINKIRGSPILLRAYKLGRIAAIVGDDIRGVDNKSNEQILREIRNYNPSKKTMYNILEARIERKNNNITSIDVLVEISKGDIRAINSKDVPSGGYMWIPPGRKLDEQLLQDVAAYGCSYDFNTRDKLFKGWQRRHVSKKVQA